MGGGAAVLANGVGVQGDFAITRGAQLAKEIAVGAGVGHHAGVLDIKLGMCIFEAQNRLACAVGPADTGLELGGHICRAAVCVGPALCGAGDDGVAVGVDVQRAASACADDLAVGQEGGGAVGGTWRVGESLRHRFFDYNCWRTVAVLKRGWRGGSRVRHLDRCPAANLNARHRVEVGVVGVFPAAGRRSDLGNNCAGGVGASCPTNEPVHAEEDVFV